MTEVAIKTRILTKVRRQFLHKRPDTIEAYNYANLLATPEQLNENAGRLLEPCFGLTEKGRTIYAGHQFLNGNYKVDTVRIEQQNRWKTVTLNLRSNNIDILPWEYCAKRLESYGNLELAAWAQRLREFHENYPKRRAAYLALANSNDSNSSVALLSRKDDALHRCREIESKYPYLKYTMYGDKKSANPVSLTYNEPFIKELGHNVDSFLELIKENGIPTIFKGNNISINTSKYYLNTSPISQNLFQEGPEIMTNIYDPKESKRQIKMQLYHLKEPGSEGFFISIYFVIKDVTCCQNNWEEPNEKVLKRDSDTTDNSDGAEDTSEDYDTN